MIRNARFRTVSSEEANLPNELVTEPRRRSYGRCILRTGKGFVAELELVFGAHWYRTRFAGKSHILDLGLGLCWFTNQNVNDIVAVDNSAELVEHFTQEGIRIKLGDAYDIPFPDQYFEGVFSCWLLEHLAEPDRAMVEIRRVLKPNGYACVIVPTPNDMVAFYDDYTHVRPYTPNALAHLAQDAGFARYHIEYLPWTLGLSYVLRILGPVFAHRYLQLSDTFLRRLWLVNRNNLMLEAWK